VARSPMTSPRDVLVRTPFFADVLDDLQLDRLSAGLNIVEFARGATLIREDDIGSSMFVMARGEAAVTVPGKVRTRRIATLRAGDIFGEMSLLTGARRAATVTALAPVKIVEIPKSALSPLIAASPELSDRFAVMLKKRQGELDRIYRGDSRWSISGLVGGDVAGVIRGFFAGAV
jgi:CRP/FNR family transcriptional regulator, cyclic AMP receptor protein